MWRFFISFAFVLISVLLCGNIRSYSSNKIQRLNIENSTLEYDFYRDSCPDAELIIKSRMSNIYSQYKTVAPSLLRLFFHDCFIQGCDASILLEDDDEINKSEKKAIPNLTLKGFGDIDVIKEELERVCPRVVSCADILSLATRDGVVLAGGPFYPVLTGRRDSTQSYYFEALSDMPSPNANISRTLDLFSARGFDERETVSLLGAHNIGRIGCEFITKRLYNFSGTGLPDPSIDPEFLTLLRVKCEDQKGSIQQTSPAPTPFSALFQNFRRSVLGISYFQALLPFFFSEGGFENHYYKSLLKGRGLLFADQQLMANNKTAGIVELYASDDGSVFRADFSRAMVKLSVLNVLTGTQGVIRESCRS